MSYFRPEDWDRSGVTRDGVDKSVALRIWYKGDQVAAHVSTATTTTDLTFEQGATTAAADVSTGDNPGSSGVIDLTSYTTLKAVMDEINSTDDWECQLIDVPGDFATNISAGNGAFIVAADTDATAATGCDILVDTSLATAETYYAGVTYNAQPSQALHSNDNMALHEILEIKATATYAGGTETISVYECDDKTGTKTLVYGPVNHSATTATDTLSLSGEPLVAAKGKRLVVLLANDTGAHTAPRLVIARRSTKFGPGLSPVKTTAFLSV